jgi:hypothetical protein
MERFRICEVPYERALLSLECLPDDIATEQAISDLDAAALLRDEGGGMGTSGSCLAFDQMKHIRLGFSFTFSRFLQPHGQSLRLC